MKTTKYNFCSNVGGASRLLAIPPHAVDSIIRNYAKGKVALSLVSMDDVIELACVMDTILFVEKEERVSAGAVFNVEVSGVLPHSNADIQSLIDQLCSEYWLLLLEDNNGYLRLVGDEETLSVFQRTDTTGLGFVARNQISFSFTCQLPHSCFFVLDVVILNP